VPQQAGPSPWDYSSDPAGDGLAQPQRWFENTALVVVSLLLCGVVGLILVWLKRQWTTTTKVVVTVVVVALTMIGVVGAVTDSTDSTSTGTGAGAGVDPDPTVSSTLAPRATSPPGTQPDDDPGIDLTYDDMQRFGFPIVFNATRQDIINVIEDDSLVVSVDTLAYDPDSATVLIALTPTYDFDSGVRDDAWLFMQAFAIFFDDGNWSDPDTGFAPSFDMTITTARYRCDSQTMKDIASGGVTREQWESACRVR
jgi:hypothetical protein